MFLPFARRRAPLVEATAHIHLCACIPPASELGCSCCLRFEQIRFPPQCPPQNTKGSLRKPFEDDPVDEAADGGGSGSGTPSGSSGWLPGTPVRLVDTLVSTLLGATGRGSPAGSTAASSPEPAEPPPAAAPKEPPARSRLRRRRYIILALVALLVLGGIGGGVGAFMASKSKGGGGSSSSTSGEVAVPSPEPSPTPAPPPPPPAEPDWSPAFPAAAELFARSPNLRSSGYISECNCGQYITGWSWSDINAPYNLEGIGVTDLSPISALQAVCFDPTTNLTTPMVRWQGAACVRVHVHACVQAPRRAGR